MGQKLLFRVDAGGNIGLGHFFRSLSLAYELQRQGNIIHFLHGKSDFWEQVEIPFEHLEIEKEETLLEVIKQGNYRVFYVDGIIEFSKQFYKEASKSLKVVFYQNISGSKNNCDVFILPAIHYAEDFFGDFDQKTKIYEGLEFVILNDKVTRLINHKNQSLQKETPTSVAVTTGGSDPKGVLLSLFEAIDFGHFKDVSFKFLIGKDFIHKRNLPEEYPANVSFDNYAVEHLLNADMAIATFGVTTYELLYMGKPILSIGHAPSNAKASKILEAKTESIIDLGLIDELDKADLDLNLRNLIENKPHRDFLSQKGSRLIDGLGVARVSNILMQLIKK